MGQGARPLCEFEGAERPGDARSAPTGTECRPRPSRFSKERFGGEMGKDFSESVDVLFHKVEDLVSTKTVVGEAITLDGLTLLPLIEVAVGVGAGAKENVNAAGGMGAKITPSAVLVIQGDSVQMINIKNQDAVSKLIDMAPGVVNKLNFGAVFGGRAKKESADEPKESVKFEEETIIEE